MINTAYIKKRQKELCMTQEQLAQQAGIRSRASLCRKIHNHDNTTLQQAWNLAKVLGLTSPEDFFLAFVQGD